MTPRALLKNENRDLVFTNQLDQLSPGRLSEIGNPATDKGDFGVLQFRQIKRERNLSLEPRLHGVAIRGNHIHRVGAGKRRYMQVGKFAVGILQCKALVFDRQGDSANEQHENHGRCRKPEPNCGTAGTGCDTLTYFLSKIRARSVTTARGLQRALELDLL